MGKKGKKKRKHAKKPINWRDLAITAVIDFIVGLILTLIAESID